jgi:hypothetical protein
MKRVLRSFTASLKSNIKTIITAVVISVVIWFAISIQIFPDVTETITDIPVRINPPSYMIQNNLQLAEDYEFTANVQIRGKRREIARLGSNDFEAVLNLSGITEEGEHVVNVIITSASNFDFEIYQTTQTERIKVERIDSITLEIVPNVNMIRNLLIEGMQIDESALTVNPTSVTLRGEKALIDTIVRAEVHVIYTDDIYSTFSVLGELRLFNSEGILIASPGVIYDNQNFMVTVPIHKIKDLPLNLEISGVPSNFNLAELRARMVLDPDELTLSSPDNSIDQRGSFDIGEISLSDITMHVLFSPTRFTIEPNLPVGYRNMSRQASVELTFVDVDGYMQHDFQIPREEITVLNAPEDFDVAIIPRELTVTVVGPAPFVQAMSYSDINVTLNLIGIPEVTDNRIDSRSVQCRISGTRVPAWVVGNPQVDVSFTRTD